MDKIDRLDWAAGMSIHAYGRRIGVRTNDPSILDRIRELLPPGWEDCFSPLVDHLFSLWVGADGGRMRNFHLLYGGFTRLARSPDLDEVLHALESHLHLYVGEYAVNRVFVHAGVVGWAGQALLLPGASRAGKSTLVAALLRAGAEYYSDEYAVLDPDGRVRPFPRRLSLRREDDTSERYGPEAFGARTGERALPVGLVAVVHYRPGARRRARSLTPGQAVLALLEHTLSAQVDPEGSLRVLEKAVAPAVCLKSARGEADETARELLETLSASSRSTPFHETRPCSPRPDSTPSRSASWPTKPWSTIRSGTRPTV
jgi:hypothetical protein